MYYLLILMTSLNFINRWLISVVGSHREIFYMYFVSLCSFYYVLLSHSFVSVNSYTVSSPVFIFLYTIHNISITVSSDFPLLKNFPLHALANVYVYTISIFSLHSFLRLFVPFLHCSPNSKYSFNVFRWHFSFLTCWIWLF